MEGRGWVRTARRVAFNQSRGFSFSHHRGTASPSTLRVTHRSLDQGRLRRGSCRGLREVLASPTQEGKRDQERAPFQPFAPMFSKGTMQSAGVCPFRAANSPAGTDPGPGSDDFLVAVLFLFGFGSPSGASSAFRGAAAAFPLAPLAVAVEVLDAGVAGAGEGVGVDRPAPPGPPAAAGADGRAGSAVSSGAGEDCPASAISRSERKLPEARAWARGGFEAGCNWNTDAQYSCGYKLVVSSKSLGARRSFAATECAPGVETAWATVRVSDNAGHAETTSLAPATLVRLLAFLSQS